MKQIKLLAVLLLIAIGIGSAVAKVPFDKIPNLSGKTSGGKVMVMNTKQFHSVFKNCQGNGRRVAVIEFGAEWCGWCREQKPVMERLAKEYAGEIDFYSIDTDANPQLSSELNISGIPYILVFPVTGAPTKLSGYHDYDEMTQAINKML